MSSGPVSVRESGSDGADWTGVLPRGRVSTVLEHVGVSVAGRPGAFLILPPVQRQQEL